MTRLLSTLFLLCIFHGLHAHTGGHGHQHTQANSHVWHLKDHGEVTGAFLMAKDDRVFIQTAAGVVHYPLEQLAKSDQTWVAHKTHKTNQLNRPLAEAQALLPHDKTMTRLTWMAFVVWIIALLLIFWLKRPRRHWAYTGMTVTLIVLFGTLEACKKDKDKEDEEEPTSFLNDPTYMETAFNKYPSSITGTHSDDDYFYVETQSLPDHQMMVGITAWIAQVPVVHYVEGDNAWAIPLSPSYSDEDISIEDNLRRGPIAVAANGIPIFNPVNASGLISYEIGELDEFGGHSGRGDDYHYHIAPMHLESTSGNYPIAYALDGFAVYGSMEPDGTDMQPLDDYHGHVYDGEYHYHGTSDYPYLLSKMRGKVTLSGTAPETQIEPQPMNTPPRNGDPRPIPNYDGNNPGDFVITDMQANGNGMGYTLTYSHMGQNGSVEYHWDENDFFTYVFTDIDGTSETQTFQR